VVDVIAVAPMSLQVAERPERAERPELPERPEQPEAAQAPAAPAAPATSVGAETPAPGRIIVNGKEISVEGAPGADVFTTTGMPFPPDIPPGVQSVATTAIVSLAMMIAAFPVFGFLKALMNRRAAQPALPSRDTTDRLQRIEAAVEAMSVEVERISEGQRFVTKVLAERSSASS
jgi:FtsP/CotA-like multicopper oxidase with cupredoxin domain